MKRTFNARITRFSCALFVILTFALSCAIPTLAQMPAGVPPRTVPNAALTKSSQAVEALFSRSDLEGARAAARDAIDLLKIATTTPALAQQVKLDAFFVEMEASALQADTRAELEAALRLCEIRPAPRDARVSIAAWRILDLAANTSDFRSAVPRIQNLLGAGQLSARSEVQSDLRAALLAAASDGTPGLSMLDLARQSGLLTEWRIAGPFGTYPNVAFEQSWDPERDGLTRASYGKRIVEQFRFENGEVKLPEYFSMSGVFYGAAQLSVPFAGKWRLRLETPGTAEA